MNKVPVPRNDPKTDYMQSKERKTQKEVLRDIQKIDDAITSASYTELVNVHRYLDGKYQACIVDWGKGMYGYHKDYGFDLDLVDESSIEYNLLLMKPKLESFCKGWNSRIATTQASQKQEMSVVLNNTVQTTITFDDARHQIEEMSALSKEQTDEIVKKIDELETIIEEQNSRKSKWDKIKPIVLWAVEKGVDVGITILKLVTQKI